MDSSLGKTQTLSLLVAVVCAAMSALQGMIVVRILNVEQLGYLGLISGIGVLFGMAQHLGLGAGTIREMAAAAGPQAHQLLFVSLALRLAVTVPVALLLLAGAGMVGRGIYGTPELVFGLKVFAGIIVAEGVLEILNNGMQGFFLFRDLFLVRIVAGATTLVGVTVGSMWLQLDGYYLGLLGATVLTGGLSAKMLGRRTDRLAEGLPRWEDLARLARQLLRVSLTIYAAKLFQNLQMLAPILLVGYFATSEETGYLKFALTVAGQLLIFSASINLINLSVFSRRFREDVGYFKRSFMAQYERFVIVSGMGALTLISFSAEISWVFGGSQYTGLRVAELVALAGLATYLTMQFHVLGSGALAPSDHLRGLVVAAMVLGLGAVAAVGLIAGNGGSTSQVLIGLILSTCFGLVWAIVRVGRVFSEYFYNWRMAVMTVLVAGAAFTASLGWSLPARSAICVVLIAVALYLGARGGTLTFSQIAGLGLWLRERVCFLLGRSVA